MNDLHWVTMTAIGLAIGASVLFAAEVVTAIWRKPVSDANALAKKAAAAAQAKQADEKGILPGALPSLDDFSKLLTALATLTESLSKAGPSLTSVIAAVLCLLIAATSGGAFRSPDHPTKDPSHVTQQPPPTRPVQPPNPKP